MAKADPLYIKQLQDELEELKQKELDQANVIKNVQAEIKLHREELSRLNSSQPLLLTTV
jgi:hypothetical protein